MLENYFIDEARQGQSERNNNNTANIHIIYSVIPCNTVLRTTVQITLSFYWLITHLYN